MKKIFILAIITLLLTGCTVVRIDTNEIDNIIDVVLSKDNKLYNHIGQGFKYYVPRGVTYIDTNELNEKLYSNGNYYYLYIDVISFYYQKEVTYEENKDVYYSSKISIRDKEGYLQITKNGSLYYVEFMYNYSKIEAVVPKEQINEVVLNASYILSTVKFNNNVISIMLNKEYFTNREKAYDIFTAKTKVNTNLNQQLEQAPIESE